MELKVILTERFKNSLSKYEKEYRNIISDLKNEFKDKDINEIFENNYIISNSVKARIIKLRIKNSSAGKGKSSGFRLIYYVNIESNELAFLEIYSKIGKNKINNLNSSEYPLMFKEYCSEKITCEKITINSIS